MHPFRGRLVSGKIIITHHISQADSEQATQAAAKHHTDWLTAFDSGLIVKISV